MRKFLFVILIFLLTLQSSFAQKCPEWLGNAVMYQIYPSTYKDSDGDGIGDLSGIISKLDYIESLGVNAIWLNPVYESGWFDGGYDVIDFYKVDPRFGTNDDLVRLVTEAHKRGIKVCLDLVAGHTSDKCEWFKRSMSEGREDKYADYYIWTDTISANEHKLLDIRMSSSDPNVDKHGHFVEVNSTRGKYYRKNYYMCQPALNYGYAHPDPSQPWEQSVNAPGPQAVRRELRNIMRFWFTKGVDGFRVDMASSLVKNDPGKVETMKLWKEMRTWIDKEFPQCIIISEWGDPQKAISAGFDVDLMLRGGVNVIAPLMYNGDTPWGEYDNIKHGYFEKDGMGSIKGCMTRYSAAYDSTRNIGYMGFATANHDYQRLNIGDRNTPDQLKVALTFFMTMPGLPIIYYGDEIGLKYKYGLPNKEGSRTDRAGTRTPMQWDNDENAGFSSCDPKAIYLPVDTDGGKITVASEDKDPESVLNYVRKLVSLRKSSSALGNKGSWEMVGSLDKPYPMIYKRTSGNESYIVALNPSGKTVSAVIPVNSEMATLYGTGKVRVKDGKSGNKITMGPVSAVILKVE
ncbi:MAG: alpha-amylase family glycosyl hydrolase [Bacteroidales bacterium]|jgi:maltose alpha-D-glucosyltransferase/alpha-amylase|nr:alpha-amylase family glycosyl hydrolase [Bacteroidales bacterium]MCI1785783.1 alpha-amylase family glycosyl hydrolase [Bacteroidales bacterium]